MFYSLKTINGRQYLYEMDSVYDKQKRKSVKKHSKCLGRFDKLPEDVRKKFLDAQAKAQLGKQRKEAMRAKELQSLSTSESTSPHFNRAPALRYGHLAFKGIWEKELGLKYKIDYIQKAATRIESWRLNDLLFYLTGLKILAPKSYYGACESKSHFLYCPWNSIVQDNFYRALDVVYDHRDELIKHAVKNHLKNTKGEIKIAFFDCTNTWFETPYDDMTWQIIQFTRQVKSDMQKRGLGSADIEAFLDSDEFATLLAEHLHTNQEQVIRMRGASKEGRFAQPIVTVALAIDQTGFPIDCQVFAGNLSEVKTIRPMLESLKKKYQVSNVYFVADRGLNATEGLDAIRQETLGFIVAQKVSRQQEKHRREMLSMQGWKNCLVDEDGNFKILEGTCNAKALRCKICDHVKTTMLEAQASKEDNGKTKRKKISVPCKIIYTFSPERQARDLATLNVQIAKASQAVEKRTLMGNPCGSGWRALIQTEKEIQEGKENKEMYRAQGLKQSVIEDRKAIAGYAAYVVSHPDKIDEPLTEEQVLSTYHRLVKIEECFRVMKSTFSIRPVYVRLKERVTAHCYLCVLALMVLKTLQEKLQKQGTPMSAQQVSRALEQALVMAIPSESTSDCRFINLDMQERFHATRTTGKGCYEQDLNETVDHEAVWESFKAERISKAHDMDLILEAVGLKPLPLLSTLSEIKSRLNIKSVSDQMMLAMEVQRLLAETAEGAKSLTP